MNPHAESYNVSMLAATEALANKQSLYPLLTSLLCAHRSPANAAMLTALSDCMAKVFDAAQAAKLTFKMNTSEGQKIVDAAPAARRLHLAAKLRTIDQSTGDLLWEMAGAVHAIADRISVGDAEGAATTKSKESEVAHG